MSFAHFTLATRDPRKTGSFFEATLGYKPVETPDNSPHDLCWLEIGPGQQMHLVRVDNFEISTHEKEFGRHIAVFHDLDDFEGLRQRLAENGARLIEPLRETPHQRFFFETPEGYVFEVIERPN